jgi:hypothetical protein
MARHRAFGNKYGVRHGYYGTRVYKIWAGMKQRCLNQNFAFYSNYGGRGISVCPEWLEFLPFWSWALESGYADGLEIDRIDNDGPYSPENCHWVTSRQNSNNRRSSLRLEAFGEVRTMVDWSRDPRCVVKLPTLKFRIRDGWVAELAVSTPPQHQFRGNQHGW